MNGHNPVESLTELFDRYGSDKGNGGDGHLYSHSYEKLIPRTSSKILEIGIGTHLNFNGSCGSILAWLDWIDGQVVGFDINEPTVSITDERFAFIKGDQSSRDDLDMLASMVGDESCDAIIDDGSHVPGHQLLSLDRLWRCVKQGGVYVIEDTHLPWGPGPFPSDVLRGDERFDGLIGVRSTGLVLRKKTTCRSKKAGS